MSILKGIKLKDDSTVHQLDYEQGIANKPKIVKSWNDLEDKPCSIESSEVELLPSQQLTFTLQDGGCVTDVMLGQDTFILEEGKTYKIMWDGVEYQKTPLKQSDEEITILALCDESLLDPTLPSTGETFMIMYIVELGQGNLGSIDTENTTHTVSISLIDEVIHQLNPKLVDAYTKEESYSRKEIDAMFGSYVDEVDTLLGGTE